MRRAVKHYVKRAGKLVPAGYDAPCVCMAPGDYLVHVDQGVTKIERRRIEPEYAGLHFAFLGCEDELFRVYREYVAPALPPAAKAKAVKAWQAYWSIMGEEDGKLMWGVPSPREIVDKLREVILEQARRDMQKRIVSVKKLGDHLKAVEAANKSAKKSKLKFVKKAL